MNFERHKDSIRSMKIGVKRNAIYIDHISILRPDDASVFQMRHIVLSKKAALERLQRICYGQFPIPVHELDILLDEKDLSELQGKEIIYAGELFKLPAFWKEP